MYCKTHLHYSCTYFLKQANTHHMYRHMYHTDKQYTKITKGTHAQQRHTHTHIYVHTHTHTHIYVHTHMYARLHTHTKCLGFTQPLH